MILTLWRFDILIDAVLEVASFFILGVFYSKKKYLNEFIVNKL